MFRVIEGVHDNVTTVATAEQDGTTSVGYPNMNPLFQFQQRIWLELISHSVEQTHGGGERKGWLYVQMVQGLHWVVLDLGGCANRSSN
jgi:hypothetical protein